MSILVTGGAGFIGSNFLNTLIDSCDDEIICLDSLTYASNLNNVSKEVILLPYDISNKDKVFEIFTAHRPKFDIDEGLKKTIDWYEKNRD